MKVIKFVLELTFEIRFCEEKDVALTDSIRISRILARYASTAASISSHNDDDPERERVRAGCTFQDYRQHISST